MSYTKQNFVAGQPLKASQLVAMEDGIVEALAGGGSSTSNLNIENGTGSGESNGIQQIPSGLDGLTENTFNFKDKNPNGVTFIEDIVSRNDTAAKTELAKYGYTDTTNDLSKLKEFYNNGLDKWYKHTESVPYGATGSRGATFGGKSAAMGSRSFSSGSSTIAKGDYSHTEGSNGIAYGTSAHVEGANSFAFGVASHVEGDSTQALGKASHAEGNSTKATGNYSHAGGWNSEAQSNYSFAHGTGVVANGTPKNAGDSQFCQTVFGQYNSENVESMFIVGNGSSSNDRKNIFEVQKNGDVWITYKEHTYSFHKLLVKLGLLGDTSITIDRTNL